MISILIPTKNRGHKLKELVGGIFSTASNPQNIEICFYIDDDDTTSMRILDSIKSHFQNVKYLAGCKIIFSDMWNKLLSIASGDIYMICGDDVIFKTKNWDTA